MQFKGFLKEPLVHFLIGGALLFAFFTWRGEDVDPESRTITISEKQVSQLAANWAQIWRREPSAQELDGLIRDYVKEEVYYREGLRLGLDQDDAIIRRRIRSKMEYLAAAEVENSIVDEPVLQAWYQNNRARYAQDSRFSFDQIYIMANDPDQAQARSKAILGELGKGADWQTLGDPLSAPRTLEQQDQRKIATNFGDGFAASLATVKGDAWQGPIRSGFGLHLVRVRDVEPGKLSPLAEVRQQVENDWRSATTKDREAKAYQALLDGYRVRIEKP
jgi:peptidyl-prolyl cis-trans isomerase C